MKKLLFLIASILLLQACDDGDITLESFDFETATVQSCPSNNLVFKINENELLLLNIPTSSFVNEETPDGSPRIVAVNSTNKIIYRIYSDNLNTGYTHNIRFVNVNFSNTENSFSFTSYNFGNHRTSL
jgi:hypothetical protein